MNDIKYTWRGIARVTVESVTPLALGSGEADGVLDSLVARDVNGLPYLPGTSIAGVLRHMEGVGQNPEENRITPEDNLWGYQSRKVCHGSELIFSEGRMVGKDGKPVDGLQKISANDEFYGQFMTDLPVRQHARIGHRGTVDGSGKYDNQVVFAGARFTFEVEIVATDEVGADKLKGILANVGSDVFRIGGGTRKGYGQMKVIRAQYKSYDLNVESQRKAYLSHSARLSDDFDGADITKDLKKETEGWKSYTLTLKANDFFLFGSGLADDEADMTPVSEKVIAWEGDKPSVTTSRKRTLIPAASVKGALAHRTAFYYNKKTQAFADQEPDLTKHIGAYNEAVKALFGYQSPEAEDDEKKGKLHRGNVLISDVFLEKVADTKILNHVKIDRFTGGAVDSALFSEKVSRGKDKEIKIELSVDTKALKERTETDKAASDVVWAFNAAIKDLLSGRLPLGGGVNRGNGIFTGTMSPEAEIKID